MKKQSLINKKMSFNTALSIIIIASLILIITIPHKSLAISSCDKITPQGVIADADCDGIPNQQDNCVFNYNPDQKDSNNNNIGDNCDSQISEVTVYPGTIVSAGSSITLEIMVTNNQLRTEKATIIIKNDELKINQQSTIIIEPHSYNRARFTINIPRCSSGEKKLSITFDEGTKAYNKIQTIKIINKQKNCVPGNTLDNTIINIFDMIEINPEDSKIMPITITNRNNDAQTYSLSLTGIKPLGTYRIDPSPIITIPGGSSKTISLYLKTEKYSSNNLGRNKIFLQISNNGFSQEIPLIVRVINPISKSSSEQLKKSIEIGFILIILAFILGAGFIAYKKLTSDIDDNYDYENEENEEDYEFKQKYSKRKKEKKQEEKSLGNIDEKFFEGINDSEEDKEFKSYY